jgi:tRNA U34 2-thiouridine synthase MnmA/TrmU
MKVIALFSGGLDSMLASELIRGQGIEVLAFFFETPFFSAERPRQSAASLNLPIKIVDATDIHLQMVANPKHGYGSNMNPCIDCHALMMRLAGEALAAEGASFIITGEVLGQRPLSQNRKALSVVAAESGYERLILRPLSAKRLPITEPEEKGWVDRDALLGLEGRSRKPQMALARELGIHNYPSPAGGCLLTDPVFSRRLEDLFQVHALPDVRDVELLKVGRHFRLGSNTKMVVGRNKNDNAVIRDLAKVEDTVLQMVSVPGPVSLLTGPTSPEIEIQALAITASYSDAKDGDPVEIRMIKGRSDEVREGKGVPKQTFRHLMV